ncbi:ankyrin repeat domain-containing protein [Azomonas macrocytogenes]|uniref:Ankyrin repeat domain-containing protein n=1 Tax=Azomonas macrocytogenes TaxID=69962 RepID=A0A839T8L7_AZOMA|nr:ankyrin repeat domain-containing protein [Azomonas macrocytogenes]MBB3104584.1 hypothetical protein [Azomonas macrocytogenes]
MRYLFAFLMLITSIALADEDDERLLDAAREGNVAVLETLTAKGANLNAVNARGYTPFIMAAYYGHTEVLAWLLKHGAEPCAEDQQGSNVYMGVAYRGYEGTAKWLLENTGCNINHTNHAGQTALMMASLFGREAIVQLYLQHGADADLVDRQGNTAASLAQGQGLTHIVRQLRFVMQ